MRAHLPATGTLMSIVGIGSLFVLAPKLGAILLGIVAVVACYIALYYDFKR